MRRREDAPQASGFEQLLTRAQTTLVLQFARRFLVFVGYPRTGHSLLASLLNAHRRAVVSHELHVGRLVAAVGGYDRRRIVEAILHQDQDFARLGRTWTGYSYAVPDAWQGRSWRPHVIGDKKGGGTTRLLVDHPDLLDRIAEATELPLMCLHVTRHPLDNIATMARRSHDGDLAVAADEYLSLAETVAAARERSHHDWLDVALEDLIAEPLGELDRIGQWLGLHCGRRWLDAASAIVADQPHRTREAKQWPSEVIEELARRTPQFPGLSRYSVTDTHAG